MKTTASLLAVPLVLIALSLAPQTAGQTADRWAAPDGSDHNPGSPNAPLATLAAALEPGADRQPASAPAPQLPRRIILRGGIYPLATPIIIKAWNSGVPATPIRIEAAPGERPVLSGGTEIQGWKKLFRPVPQLPAAAQDRVWVAQAPENHGHWVEFRQLWVNDAKAIRAREPNDEKLARLTAWDKPHQTATFPASALAGVRLPARMEMVIDQVWEIADLRVQSIRVQGTEAAVTFRQPESALEFGHPWPPVIVNTNYCAPFFLANALEFLDSPGEWFEDLRVGKIYYWPRAGEDMTSARVFAPGLETLVQIEGTPGRPAAEIQFQGITFAHTTWLRPSVQGHVPLQAGMFMLEARKLSPRGTPYQPKLDNVAWIGRPPAAVQVKNATRISFKNCTFEHLAAAGLDFESSTRNDRVQGCTFRDIGGNGLQIGKFSDTNVETHVPYLPPDESEICAQEEISDNVITDCGSEDWGCVGIAVGYAQKVSLEHNEVFNLPYTGISVGWGWTKMTNASRDNLVRANRIHHVGRRLGDLGGIYTLSAQPGTVVAENSITDIQPSVYVSDPQHWFYLYLDEGSSGITVRDNGCPAEKFLKNANGPGNVWTNNGPQVSEKIKNAAGLEPAFQSLLPAGPAATP
jgi:hypothetical protein